MIGVRPDFGRRLDVGAHPDAVGLQPGLLEGEHLLDLLGDLAALAPGRAMLGEEDEVTDDGGGPLGRGVDDPQGLLDLESDGRLGEEVELRHDDGQRVVDLVGHAGGQTIDGGKALSLDHFGLGPAEVVELAVDLAVEARIIEGEADLVGHALEQGHFLVGEPVLGLAAEREGAQDAVARPDGNADEAADAVRAHGRPRRGQEIGLAARVVHPAPAPGQRDTADQSVAHGQLEVDAAELVGEAPLPAQQEALTVRRDQMQARDLVTGDVRESGERFLKHLVEIERSTHGLRDGSKDLEVPDHSRGLIDAHGYGNGSKSSATPIVVDRKDGVMI